MENHVHFCRDFVKAKHGAGFVSIAIS